REDKQVCYRKEKTVLKPSMGVQPFCLSETKKKKRFPEEAITVISELKMAETAPAVTIQEMKTEPSFLLNQDTQSNLKTATSDYCTDVFSSLEGKQMAIEVHEDLKEKRGDNTYEGKEAPICVPWLIDQGKTNLMGNYESFFHSNNSDSVENTQTCDKLTFLEPVQPSSHSSLSQVVERASPEKEPEDTTQREQQNTLQSETTHQSISNDLQEHCKEFNMVAYVPEMFVKVSTKDIKRFGLEKVKDFCVSNSVFGNMSKSFTELEQVELFDQKRFQNNNNNISGHVLSLDQFLKYCQSFDHCEKVLKFDLKQPDTCFRKPCDSFATIQEEHSVVNIPRH